MLQLDQMKTEIQQYEDTMHEVLHSLDLEYKKRTRSFILWISNTKSSALKSCSASRKHRISGQTPMSQTRK